MKLCEVYGSQRQRVDVSANRADVDKPYWGNRCVIWISPVVSASSSLSRAEEMITEDFGGPVSAPLPQMLIEIFADRNPIDVG